MSDVVISVAVVFAGVLVGAGVPLLVGYLWEVGVE
jgi:hypothetical protein